MCSTSLISMDRDADSDKFSDLPETLSEPSDDSRAPSNASSMTDGSIDRPSSDRSLRQNHRDTQDPDQLRRQTSGRSPLVSVPDAGAVHEQDASPRDAEPTGEQQGPHAAVKDVRQRGAVLNLTKSKAGAVSRARPRPAAKPRKRFRPKHAHHDPVSTSQQEYWTRAVENLSRFPETRAMAASITNCGTTRTADGRTIRTIKCGHPFCPQCRRAQIQRRVAAANRTFDHPHFRTLWWVTVLNAVLPGSPMDLDVRDPFELQKPLLAPPATSIRDWIGPALARAKTDLDKCLASLAPASLAADGSFEFDVLPVTGAGA